MKARWLIATALCGALSGCAAAKAADNCAGNACGSVSMGFSGGCYHFTNGANRRVKVEVRNWGTTLAKPLAPGETWTPVFGSGCFATFYLPYHADFN